jgi:hypothetical protein
MMIIRNSDQSYVQRIQLFFRTTSRVGGDQGVEPAQSSNRGWRIILDMPRLFYLASAAVQERLRLCGVGQIDHSSLQTNQLSLVEANQVLDGLLSLGATPLLALPALLAEKDGSQDEPIKR